jgi:4-hydroxy 2-oxovalerate aldolase
MENLDNLKVIDVTLRDGGYRNNFGFGMDYVLNHARLVQASGVEYIEIGYRNGSIIHNDNMGVTAYGSNDYIRTLKQELPGMNLVMIAHAANITDTDIHEMAEHGVAMLRFCMNAKNVDETLRLARLAKQCGIQTSINVVRISSIDFPTLATMVSQVEECRDAIDVIYFADSNGNLTPDSVQKIADEIKRGTSVGLGFHAHDNMGLAMANSIAAVGHGAHFIDASLLGMGKGIGNLKLEKWISYLLMNGSKKYSLVPLLQAVDQLRANEAYSEDLQEYSIDILCGLHNLPFTDRAKAEAILTGTAL